MFPFYLQTGNNIKTRMFGWRGTRFLLSVGGSNKMGHELFISARQISTYVLKRKKHLAFVVVRVLPKHNEPFPEFLLSADRT